MLTKVMCLNLTHRMAVQLTTPCAATIPQTALITRRSTSWPTPAPRRTHDAQRKPEHYTLQYPLNVGYSIYFLLFTVCIWWWHLPTAEIIYIYENGAELCTYTGLHTQISTHIYIYIYTHTHTHIILTKYKTFSRIKCSSINSCPDSYVELHHTFLSVWPCRKFWGSALPTFDCVKFWRHNKTCLYEQRLAEISAGIKPNTTFCPHSARFPRCCLRGTNWTYKI